MQGRPRHVAQHYRRSERHSFRKCKLSLVWWKHKVDALDMTLARETITNDTTVLTFSILMHNTTHTLHSISLTVFVFHFAPISIKLHSLYMHRSRSLSHPGLHTFYSPSLLHAHRTRERKKEEESKSQRKRKMEISFFFIFVCWMRMNTNERIDSRRWHNNRPKHLWNKIRTVATEEKTTHMRGSQDPRERGRAGQWRKCGSRWQCVCAGRQLSDKHKLLTIRLRNMQ